MKHNNMSTDPSDDPYPNFTEAVAAVHKRTTDVTKYGRAWGYTLVDWQGKKRRQIFESRRLAEWRLTEVRLCMIADILRIDILEILVRIRDAQKRAIIDPFQSEVAEDWRNYIPEGLNPYDPEKQPPFEGEFYLRKQEGSRDIFIDSDENIGRRNTQMKLRKLAISIAEERVSEIRLGADGKWSFDATERDGRCFTTKYDSELCAHNQRAVLCLGIAADFLRLDIRKRLEAFDPILRDGYFLPDVTPHLGVWWKWLPHRMEVPRIPGDRIYFDLSPF